MEDASQTARNRVPESGSRVSINNKLEQWISRVADDENAPEDLRNSAQKISQNASELRRSVPVTLVQELAQHAALRREPGKTPKTKAAYLDDFLAGAKWYFAEGQPPPKRDYDNESPVEKIRNDAAARDYARMTKNVDPRRSAAQGQSFAADLKVANKESLAVFNCLLTVVGAFVFGYFATGYAIGANVVAQVLVALILSTVVAVADIYFLLKKLYVQERLVDEASKGIPRDKFSERSNISVKSKDD